MIRIFLSIIFLFLLVNCSFNENSRIWNNKNKELENNKKTKNTKIILDKKKETPKELNSTLKLNLSKIFMNNDIFDNQNNFGVQNYSGKLNKINSYKFSRFNEPEQFNFQPLFSYCDCCYHKSQVSLYFVVLALHSLVSTRLNDPCICVLHKINSYPLCY